MGVHERWEQQAQKKKSEWFKFPEGGLPEIWEKLRRRIPSDPLYYDNRNYAPYFIVYDRQQCSFAFELEWKYFGIKVPSSKFTVFRSTKGACALPPKTKPTPVSGCDYSHCGWASIFVATGYRLEYSNQPNPPKRSVRSVVGSYASVYHILAPDDLDGFPRHRPLKNILLGIADEAYSYNVNINGINFAGTQWVACNHAEDGTSPNPPFGRIVFPRQYVKCFILQIPAVRNTKANTDAIIAHFAEHELIDWQTEVQTDNCKFNYCNTPIPKIAPPPPLPPTKDKEKEDKGMCCEQLEGLLRLLIKRIGKLPAKVPQDLTNPNKGLRTINSLAEYHAQQIRLLDSLFGQFPFEIKVEDTDITQEGNQSATYKIPNLAEAIAEVMGILLVLRTESSATLDVSARALLEAVAAKNSAIQSYHAALANSDFLGYKIKWKDELIPCTIDPSQQNFDLMLKDTNQKLSVIDCDDKENLQKMLAPLLLMAARWTAQNVKTFRGTGTDIVEQIKEVLRIAGDLPKDFDKVIREEQGTNEDGEKKPAKADDFDIFLESVETGFNSLAGVEDITKPYGKPYENRPKIRRLGVINDGEGNNV